MTNMLATIAPKSDQLNADDLIGGRALTIAITKVSSCSEPDQPIAIHFEGDNGKPFKPCKSMRRVLVNAWGGDGSKYVGRRMTLYRDDKVQFGGLAVGGIRISHMSDIDRDVTMALTASKANRKPFTVKPLAGAPTPAPTQQQPTPPPSQEAPGAPSTAPSLAERADRFEVALRACLAGPQLKQTWDKAAGLRTDLDRADPERLAVLTTLFDELDAALAQPAETY